MAFDKYDFFTNGLPFLNTLIFAASIFLLVFVLLDMFVVFVLLNILIGAARVIRYHARLSAVRTRNPDAASEEYEYGLDDWFCGNEDL